MAAVAPGGEEDGPKGLSPAFLRLALRGERGCWRRIFALALLVVAVGGCRRRPLALDGDDGGSGGGVEYVDDVRQREQAFLDEEGGDGPADGLGGVRRGDADGWGQGLVPLAEGGLCVRCDG